MSFKFTIEKKMKNGLGRAGVYETPHGSIETPAFVVVGTKGTIKSLSPEQVKSIGAQVVLANTYHLYLQPGEDLVREAGGIHKFMKWDGPTMTDSGGFQVFSLGEAYGKQISKISTGEYCETDADDEGLPAQAGGHLKLAEIDENGVTFRSHIDGSTHRFTPESSIQIQHNIGADIIFAFDECTSPLASHEYQKEAMDRTHRWAQRSLEEHKRLGKQTANKSPQALFGIVQGGRFEDLRKESAKIISEMDFDGFGIGGSFDKKDMYTVVGWVNKILPEDKPRHLLGIGEPADLFGGIENGVDLFDCVAPTRMARNGTLYTKNGRINILNAKFTKDLSPIEAGCSCYTCSPRLATPEEGQGGAGFTRAYISHLFKAKEMLASTLASIHNLHFIVNLVKDIRHSILDGKFEEFKEEFLAKYYR